MIWPFRHKPQAEPPKYFARPAFPVYGSRHEAVIVAFLEEAKQHGKRLQPGERFRLSLPARMRNPLDIGDNDELSGPIMARARDFGLSVTGVYNWVFTFTWNGEPVDPETAAVAHEA